MTVVDRCGTTMRRGISAHVPEMEIMHESVPEKTPEESDDEQTLPDYRHISHFLVGFNPAFHLPFLPF